MRVRSHYQTNTSVTLCEENSHDPIERKMKFGEHLASHITPEWRTQYIDYEQMKSMLYSALEQAPLAEVGEEEVLTIYFEKCEESFFAFCDEELDKINTFYAEKISEATRQFSMLKQKLDNSTKANKRHSDLRTLGILKKTNADLKAAFSEFYLSLILLQNYQNLNFTGFGKIMKKHDKEMKTDAGSIWREKHVESAFFHTSKDIDNLLEATRSTVTNEIEDGDRKKAMKRLRVDTNTFGYRESLWTTFKMGLCLGAFLVLIIAAFLSVVYHYETNNELVARNDWRVAVRLYRGPFLVILFLFLLGINVYGWRKSGVNHILIFELDPRNHLSEQNIQLSERF